MSNLFQQTPYYCPTIGGMGFQSTAASLALSSQLVLGTSGAAFGVRFLAPIGGVHVVSVYVFLTAVDATGHNLTAYLCPFGANANTPSASPLTTVTVAGGTTANKWVKFDFSGYTTALTDNNFYWIVMGDATATNLNYQVRRTSSAYTTTPGNNAGIYGGAIGLAGYTSTNGFSGAGTGIACPPMIIVFSSGSSYGMPYTSSAVDNVSLERGLYAAGFTEQISLAGISFVSSSTYTTFQVLDGSTAPGGAAWSGFNGGSALSLTAQEAAIGILMFPGGPITFPKATPFRFTFRATTTSSSPGYSQVEDPATPGTDAVNCCLAQGNFCRTIDNGAGGWTNTATQLPCINLILADQVAVAGGGGIARAWTRGYF